MSGRSAGPPGAPRVKMATIARGGAPLGHPVYPLGLFSCIQLDRVSWDGPHTKYSTLEMTSSFTHLNQQQHQCGVGKRSEGKSSVWTSRRSDAEKKHNKAFKLWSNRFSFLHCDCYLHSNHLRTYITCYNKQMLLLFTTLHNYSRFHVVGATNSGALSLQILAPV